MNYKERTAEAIFRRYWRGVRLIRLLKWVGCLVCMGLLLRSIWWTPSEWKFLLIFALYLGYLYVLRLVNSFRFLSLNVILNRDCDAVKFTEVSRLLRDRVGTRSSGMAGLNVAWGLYWSGRFDEAAGALTDVDLKGKNVQGRLLLRNLDFNCRLARGETAGARNVRQETRGFVERLKAGSAARKQGETLLELMDAALALEEGDYTAFRTIREYLAGADTVPLQRVSAAYQLAKADLAQGETENARARLTEAAERGGTLFVAEEARKLLAAMEP